jgi:hypothetical protein
MSALPTAAWLLLLCLVPIAIPAQDVGYIDLTDNVFRESTRRVRTGGGSCGGTSYSQKSQSEVTVTVVSLDKSRYQIGEEATFEIKILNSGKRTIVVPWTPHLGDLEPDDSQIPYKYRVGTVELLFSDPEGRGFFVLESLYGSRRLPGSLRELEPAQWFTVRGRKRIVLFGENWGKKALRDSGFVEAKVTGSYQQDIATYSPKDGGSHIRQCIPLPCQRTNSIVVVIERPRP